MKISVKGTGKTILLYEKYLRKAMNQYNITTEVSEVAHHNAVVNTTASFIVEGAAYYPAVVLENKHFKNLRVSVTCENFRYEKFAGRWHGAFTTCRKLSDSVTLCKSFDDDDADSQNLDDYELLEEWEARNRC